MVQLLGLVLISFILTSLLLVPFIDFLFYLKRKNKKISDQRSKEKSTTLTDTPIHNQLLVGKDLETPVGGGLLIIPVVVVLTYVVLTLTTGLDDQFYPLLLAMISFGTIGFFDDIKKMLLAFSGKYSGMRTRYLFLLQLAAATLVAAVLYFYLGFNNIYVPLFGNIILGIWYMPLAIFIIIAFANAFNISDGLDGLSTGLLTICLVSFLALASSVFNQTLAVFVGIWIGALIAYLYFNVYPARIYLGDAGAFAFGATLAVAGLLTGKIVGLAVIGGMFVVIVGSSLIQILSKRFLKRKFLPVAPIHMYFKYLGWEEPKIVVRFWLAGSIFAILGLWLSLLS